MTLRPALDTMLVQMPFGHEWAAPLLDWSLGQATRKQKTCASPLPMWCPSTAILHGVFVCFILPSLYLYPYIVCVCLWCSCTSTSPGHAHRYPISFSYLLGTTTLEILTSLHDFGVAWLTGCTFISPPNPFLLAKLERQGFLSGITQQIHDGPRNIRWRWWSEMHSLL